MSLPNRRKCRKGGGFKNSFGNGRKFGRQEDEQALLMLNSRSMWCTLVRMLHGELRQLPLPPALDL